VSTRLPFADVEIPAVDAVQIGWLPASLSLVARWEVTCGVCRTRFRRVLIELLWGTSMSWVGCPACGAHNLLPHHPSVAGRG
jgi:hypothetical protein